MKDASASAMETTSRDVIASDARPTAQDLHRWLADTLTQVLGGRPTSFGLSLLHHAANVDGVDVFLVCDMSGQSRAVIHCSAPAAPAMVERNTVRAHKAKVALGLSAGAAILDPLFEGTVQGLSISVHFYCKPLSRSRMLGWIEGSLLRAPLLKWLWDVTCSTVRDLDTLAVEEGYAKPLRTMAGSEWLPLDLRAAAKRAVARLDTGAWKPKHVLMHGDLWKGNVLIRPNSSAARAQAWRDRFVIIDWPGSEVLGYPIFDLIRLSRTLPIGPRRLRNELRRHCQVLACDPADATSYLVSAFAHIAMNLEHFPLDAFLHITESSVAMIKRAQFTPEEVYPDAA